MAIVPLSKITCYGPTDRKPEVLEGLQTLGCLHLVNLRPDDSRREGRAGIFAESEEALRYLEACPIQRRTGRDEDFDLDRVTEEVLQIRERTEELSEEADQLRQEIVRQRPWGEFRLPRSKELRGLRFWFYIVPHYRLRDVRRIEPPWQVVSRDNRFDYVVVIAPTEPPGMPVPRVDLDPRPLSELRRRLEEAEDELEDLHWHRVSLTRYRTAIQQTLAVAADRQRLEEATWKTWDAGRVFALRGWAPVATVPRLREFAQAETLALTIDPPGEDEQPPTLLDNPEPVAGGEEAVKFYMTPGYRMWDPSVVVFFSFCLFFAMIIADAGYGLLLGAVVWLLRNKLDDTPAKRRVRRLGGALAVTSIAYGIISGAYLGIAPEPGTLLSYVHLIDSKDLSLMMPLSILIGALHVGLGIGATGYRQRGSWQVLSSYGWGGMLLGGLLLGAAVTETGPASLLEPAMQSGIGLLALGGILVLGFSSSRPWPPRGIMDVVGRIWDGMQSLTGVTSAFGDVLSYLRLFALGLASTQLAVTFNTLAAQAASDPALGVLLGTLVFVIGHAFNFILAVLSGVVHGLRLNCIEFFKWSLPEEGYPFRPFSRNA